MGAGLTESYDCAASQSINAGDIVVLTNVSGVVRVRKMVQDEIDDNYTNTSVAGLLGIAKHNCYTDANGYATVQAAPPSTVNAMSAPVYKLPSYSSGLSADVANGVAKLLVQIFDDNSEFKIRAQTSNGGANSAVTVNSIKIGLPIGLQLYNTSDFASDENSSGAAVIGVVSSVIETDPNFNVSSAQCRYAFRVSRTYQQYNNGGIYYDE